MRCKIFTARLRRDPFCPEKVRSDMDGGCSVDFEGVTSSSYTFAENCDSDFEEKDEASVVDADGDMVLSRKRKKRRRHTQQVTLEHAVATPLSQVQQF